MVHDTPGGLMPRKPRARATFGTIRQLPSGRYQAYYRHQARRIVAPTTFLTLTDARGWLSVQQASIVMGTWNPAAAESQRRAAPTLSEYSAAWLASRPLRPRTRQEYSRVLEQHLVPTFGGQPMDAITPADVRTWYGQLAPEHPTRRAHAYALLRTIMRAAVEDDLIGANPCRIRGGGQVRRQREIRPATLAELEAIVEATPERFRAMVLLAAWLGLRFGEVTELRRRDIDLAGGTVRVERAVSRTRGGLHVGDPKTEAGRRTIALPPHLTAPVRQHLARHVAASPDALLFPSPAGRQLAPSSVYEWWYPARQAAGRPDLRFHDLRHTGATLAASTGATLAELMHRLGHSTPAMAMRYQHAAADRDRAIATALSEIASGQVAALPRRSG
jgi:integrase